MFNDNNNKGMLITRAAIHLRRVDAWPLAGHMHNDLVAINVPYHVYIICIMYIDRHHRIIISVNGNDSNLLT